MQEQAFPGPRAAAPKSWLGTALTFIVSIDGVTLWLILALFAYQDWPVGMRVGLLIGYFAVKLTPVVRRHASMIYRCVLPLLIGFACVEVYDFLRESEIDLPYLRFKDEYRESFYSGVATLYAIITALALVKGIEDFDSLKRTIADEVFTIREIVNLAIYLRGGENPETMPSLRSIKKMLADYALNVARKHDLAAAGPNDAILRECQSEIGKLRRERGGEADAISLIMKAHSDLSTLRAKADRRGRRKNPDLSDRGAVDHGARPNPAVHGHAGGAERRRCLRIRRERADDGPVLHHLLDGRSQQLPVADAVGHQRPLRRLLESQARSLRHALCEPPGRDRERGPGGSARMTARSG
jgi:hypothetical protein